MFLFGAEFNKKPKKQNNWIGRRAGKEKTIPKQGKQSFRDGHWAAGFSSTVFHLHFR
jgi:hypothetical protein